uniref:Uncharacterized protein n=1 Tax=Canis lupus dingo TaxID=286419 RepID=A0A8C0LAK8_CANLU
MDTLDEIVKAKMKRGKRFLEKREPKLSENIKNAMLMYRGNVNSMVTQVLKDVYALEKPIVTLAEEKKITVTMCVTSHFAFPHLQNGNSGLDGSLITDKVR